MALGDDFPKDTQEEVDSIGTLLRAEVEKEIRNVYDSIWEGDVGKIANMPVESFLPMLALRHLGSFSKEFSLSPEGIEYGFDPEMYFEKLRETPKKKKSLLKAIESEFTVPEEDEDPKVLSLIIDENAINSFILDFVLVEKAFSLREYFKKDARLREMISQMNTDNIGMALPEILEEYDRGLAADFYMSMSHSLIAKKLPETKVSGFQMDKNGNFRFILNGSVTLLVQKKKNEWEEARSIYASITAKGKVITKELSETEKAMVVFPKALELSSLKIFNKEEEAQTMEEMVLTSGFNVQFEQALKMVEPFEIPMNNPPTPPEVECLGFALSDADIKFKKGYLEMSCGYKLVDKPSNPALCESFIETLREGPKQALEDAGGLFDGTLDPKAFYEQKTKELEERLGKNQDDEEFEPEQTVDLDADKEEPSNVQDEL